MKMKEKAFVLTSIVMILAFIGIWSLSVLESEREITVVTNDLKIYTDDNGYFGWLRGAIEISSRHANRVSQILDSEEDNWHLVTSYGESATKEINILIKENLYYVSLTRNAFNMQNNYDSYLRYSVACWDYLMKAGIEKTTEHPDDLIFSNYIQKAISYANKAETHMAYVNNAIGSEE